MTEAARRWRKRWLIWLLSAVSSFVVMETKALVLRAQGTSGATLSSALRHWLGVHPRVSRRVLLRAAFAGFWTWFVIHIVRDEPKEGDGEV